jgi:hypothetical protein
MGVTLRSAPTIAWAILALATVASLVVGTDHGLHDRDAVAVALLVVAFAKVFVVGRHFMELHVAAVPLRRAFDAYVAIVGATLVALVVAL